MYPSIPVDLLCSITLLASASIELSRQFVVIESTYCPECVSQPIGDVHMLRSLPFLDNIRNFLRPFKW